MSRRAVAPVVGVCLMLVVTVMLAALVGAFVIGFSEGTANAPEAAITADRNGNEIFLTHMAGDPLDVHDLTIKIFVDGEPLEDQPDVPTSGGMEGFFGFPTGPFDEGNDNIWTAGEVASLTIASTTNSPQPTPESRVVVKIYADNEIVTVATA